VKSQLGAGVRSSHGRPRRSYRCADGDKREARSTSRVRSFGLGFQLVATRGTAAVLE
jgi:hypothetical protein